jgi:hypothetical protein
MLPLLLLAATIHADLPHDGDQDTIRTFDLATLDLPGALALQGRQARFTAETGIWPWWCRGWVIFDAAGPPPLHRTVWLRHRGPRDEQAGKRVVVDGRLSVLWHPARSWPGGMHFPAFVEIRVVEK